MTYKEKKLKDFEEFCLDKGVLFTDRKMMAGFLYETIDEILGCLPKKMKESVEDGRAIYTGAVMFNTAIQRFLNELESKTLEQKAGEL